MKTKYFLILISIFGCSSREQLKNANFEYGSGEKDLIRLISEEEFEEILGYNAAVKQFGDESLLIKMESLKIDKYLSEKLLYDDDEECGYARGYHKALKLIEESNSKNQCTFWSK
jgi:hypothetical protein